MEWTSVHVLHTAGELLIESPAVHLYGKNSKKKKRTAHDSNPETRDKVQHASVVKTKVTSKGPIRNAVSDAREMAAISKYTYTSGAKQYTLLSVHLP